MTERERFIKALKREPLTGHVPTFELVFFLTLEALGRIHPSQQIFGQWKQMSPREQTLHFEYMADTYIETAEKYRHSAIFVHPNPGDDESVIRLLETIREKSGDKYFIMMHGDCTFDIPNGDNMLDFAVRMYEDEEGLKAEAERRLAESVRLAEVLARRPGLLDGFALCSDYCFNVNPFFSPDTFSVFVTPYLKRVIDAYRSLGFFTIKHTDGNIMPILDQMVECGPDALHSLDPQAGVDLAEVKRLYGDRVALCGNVNCGLLQTGTEEDVVRDVRRALRDGMQGWGYVFCTSNCAYTGLPLERYELLNRIWWEEGVYP
ncbi:MAG: hypothetical protein IJM21_01325 [Clostridia bacterium]|nr:hypothetical protein [Clostridia bacterium]